MNSHFDAIIIGAGHNGLVTACYLAKAGKKVLLLERRHLVGGACVTDESTFTGFKVSNAAYVNSLFHKQIEKDLRLRDYGYKVLERNPSSFTPTEEGKHLFLGPDDRLNQSEISKFSKRDAENYPKYNQKLEHLAKVIEPILSGKPPNVLKPGLKDLWNMWKLSSSFRSLGPDLQEAIEFLTGSARPILERWFESEPLLSTLATDAVIGAMAAPSMPGTGYVLFHHVMGETNGKRGVWGYVQGGMGTLTKVLAKIATDLGSTILCETPVQKILVKNNRAIGVVTTEGKEFTAPIVASNADCNVTFNKLMSPDCLPEDFKRGIDRINYDSASLKINVALSELPDFIALPGKIAGPQHRGTIHICKDLDTIERGYDDAKYGEPSRVPILECTIPSAVDPTVAPEGKHLMSMFIQYAPYKLKNGNWDQLKDAFADRCFDLLNTYAPNFRSSVIDRQVLTPLDFEREYSLTGGNIFQGSMIMNQLFFMRPTLGYSYRTPIQGLFLCGAAAHPGGGVTGIPGWNCAKEILGKW
ncbi:MAG: NAD(P)/FAD-dependent oxidoreductase [Gemmataceae bacterium]|nr:NAD(P)/FAD-dependent oxidoreductase [Gemmataceae bacterium]